MTYTSVCPPGHNHHASVTCYVNHKCRCAACVKTWQDRNSRRRKLIAYGRYVSPFTDATPTLDHIENLHTTGLTYGAIAAAAGVDVNTILNITNGRSHHISHDTANKIRSVDRDSTSVPTKSWYSALGARRRLQALVARGWSLSALAREAGLSPQRIQQIITRPRITVGVHRRMSALYERLWDQQPPLTTPAERGSYSKALSMATRRRWAPPLAWDDIDTDPDAPTTELEDTIDEIAIELAIAGERVELNHAEKLEGLRRMHPMKWSNLLIAEHLGCDERTVVRLRRELDLPGWDQNEVLDRRAA